MELSEILILICTCLGLVWAGFNAFCVLSIKVKPDRY